MNSNRSKSRYSFKPKCPYINLLWTYILYYCSLMMGLPGGSVVKNLPSNAGNLGSISGLGRSPGEEKGYPLQSSGLEHSMDCIVHAVAESDTTERLSCEIVLWILIQYVLFASFLVSPLIFPQHLRKIAVRCPKMGNFFPSLPQGSRARPSRSHGNTPHTWSSVSREMRMFSLWLDFDSFWFLWAFLSLHSFPVRF